MKRVLYLLCSLFAASPPLIADPHPIGDLSIEELLNMEVTSVSKRAQSLSDAAAAVFVISNEDIRRTGVTSIPEALRLAPGIDVARLNSHTWAVTSRGFNGRFANKLLVMIDGRSVYTPAFSGVYWDTQDVMLEDVKRIEVIRGPGATLWGANAVNGVINIITYSAEETEGGLLSAGFGSEEQGFGALRYGTKLGDDTFARVYAKAFNRDEFSTAEGDNSGDEWYKLQGGFRLDSRFSDRDQLTVQGDLYYSESQQMLNIPSIESPTYFASTDDKTKASGWNISSRYTHTLSPTEEISVQFHYDHYQRDEFIVREKRHTLDLEFQHHFDWNNHHSIIWGLGYRYSRDETQASILSSFSPSSRNLQLFHGFFQDKIILFDDKLRFTFGSKFEYNDYTGFEVQPSARFMWTPATGHRFWGAISRSVRTPSRLEQDIALLQRIVPIQTATATVPVSSFLVGNKNFRSETQLSYEIGYRANFDNVVSLDLTAFYNSYDRLRGISSPRFQGNRILIDFENNNEADTYGMEMAVMWQMLDWWRWDLNYSYLGTDLDRPTNGRVSVSPRHQASLHAAITPTSDINIDLFLRYVGEASVFALQENDMQKVDDYLSLDMRLAWRPIPSLELSLVGQNLLNNRHQEFVPEAFATEAQVPRGVYGKLLWNF